MSSAFEAIETSTVAALLTVPGMLYAKAVPIAEQFRKGSTDEEFLAEKPDGYPGCTVSLNDDEVEIQRADQQLGAASVFYRAPVYVAMFVVSDGTQPDVRKTAWSLGELVQQTLAISVPVYTGATMWPLLPSNLMPIIVDANTYGLLMKFWARFQYGIG